jgi:RHS repeat-associated protein
MTTIRYTTINGEVIAEKRNGVRRLYVPDPLGSTVALLDNTQTQVDTFTYWPYGEVRTSTGTTSPPFQFVGTKGYYTNGVGRTYVRARYLHTQKGRWLTEDPIAFNSGGDANVYRYVRCNPVSSVDISGAAQSNPNLSSFNLSGSQCQIAHPGLPCLWYGIYFCSNGRRVNWITCAYDCVLLWCFTWFLEPPCPCPKSGTATSPTFPWQTCNKAYYVVFAGEQGKGFGAGNDA